MCWNLSELWRSQHFSMCEVLSALCLRAALTSCAPSLQLWELARFYLGFSSLFCGLETLPSSSSWDSYRTHFACSCFSGIALSFLLSDIHGLITTCFIYFILFYFVLFFAYSRQEVNPVFVIHFGQKRSKHMTLKKKKKSIPNSPLKASKSKVVLFVLYFVFL